MIFLAEDDAVNYNQQSELDFVATNQHSSTVKSFSITTDEAESDQHITTSKQQAIHCEHSLKNRVSSSNDIGNVGAVIADFCSYCTSAMDLFYFH